MSEASEIKRMGARAQKNSGRGAHDKGDAILEPFLIDIKEYSNSFSVSRDNWAKLSLDAFKAGRRIPAFYLALGEESSNDKLRLCVVSYDMFQEMREAWLEKYEGIDE
jgi:hypothetical protein